MEKIGQLIMIENTDYQLIPVEGDENGWNVRFLTGTYPESIIRYGNIVMDGKTQADVNLRFDFMVINSPLDWLTSENIDLQIQAGDVLHAIIKTGIEDNSLITKDRNES